MSGPELHVVIEVGARPERLWFEAPPEPWPSFVRLWGSTSEEDVARFVVLVSTYGRSGGEPASSIQDVLDDFPHVLPGGIAVVSDEHAVMPSCCCGLEHWPEWRQFLTTGQSPWTGHDPAPLLERRATNARLDAPLEPAEFHSGGTTLLQTAPPNKPLKQTAAPRRDHDRLPLAGGDVPRAGSSLPATSPFPDAAAA
jgi:hypothetical protein